MKTRRFAALAAAVTATWTVATINVMAESSEPSIPVGSISASPTVVQTGTKPRLDWTIQHPSIAEDYLDITDPATVTPEQDMLCEIRMLGLGVTASSNGKLVYYRTRGQIGYNSSSTWTTIYDGKQTDPIVQQQGIVKSSFLVNANKAMNFAGQYYDNGKWQTLYTSLSGDHIHTLVNGDACPSNVPGYNAPTLEKFLKPYLDSNKKVKIGPMDVIVIMELTHSNKGDTGYDLQDLAMLLTFHTPPAP